MPFRIRGGEDVEKSFIAEAGDLGIQGIAGHRSVGGIRLSLYNSITVKEVETVASFMIKFAKKCS